MAAPKEKSKVITAFVLDFETGGLDCQTNAATQLSVHAVRLDTFEVMETFNEYIYPYAYQPLVKAKRKKLVSKYELDDERLMAYDKSAEDVSGITMRTLEEKGVMLQQFCDDLMTFITRNTFTTGRSDKPVLVGQNVAFDIGFLQQALCYCKRYDDFCRLVRCSKDYWGNRQPCYIDTLVLCQLAMSHKREAESWKLGDLCAVLGIELDDAHDADADVTATREILQALTARMRNATGGDGDGSLVTTEKERTRPHFKI